MTPIIHSDNLYIIRTGDLSNMNSRRFKDAGTDLNPNERRFRPACEEDSDEQSLQNFYFSLPRPKQLQSKALGRIQTHKVRDYVTSALESAIFSCDLYNYYNKSVVIYMLIYTNLLTATL